STLTLPGPEAWKDPLGAMPLPNGTSTHDLITRIQDAIEKGRAAYQSSQEFDDDYRAFMVVVRVLQTKGNPDSICRSPEAAKAFLDAKTKLSEFKLARLQFSSMLTPLRAAKDDHEALTPAWRSQIERILEYDQSSASLETDLSNRFSEQMQQEIDDRDCKD